jgi:hypothetical protein
MFAATNFGQNTVLLHLPVESAQQSLKTFASTKLYISHIKELYFTLANQACQFREFNPASGVDEPRLSVLTLLIPTDGYPAVDLLDEGGAQFA